MTSLGKDFFSNVLKIAGSTFFAQLIAFITIPIFSRIFLPQTIGEFALFTSITGLLSVFGTGRYELALMLPKERELAIKILSIGLFIAFIWMCFLFIIIIFFKNKITLIGKFDTIANYLYFIPITIFFICSNKMFTYWNNREKYFTINAKLNVFNSILSKVSNVLVGFIGFATSSALILINLCVLFFENLIRIKLFIKQNNIHDIFSKQSIPLFKTVFVRYKKFPLIDVWSGFLDGGSILIVPILLSIFFSTTDVGLYSQSLMLIQIPLTLIASAFAQVFFQRLSNSKHNAKEFSGLVTKLFVILLQIGIPIFTVIFLWGKELFSFFLGKQWLLSGTYAELLAPWCCLKLCFSPLSVVFSVLERQGLSLLFTVFVFTIRVISILIGGYFNDVYLAILLFGISGFICNLLGIIMIFRLSRVNLRELIPLLFKNPIYLMKND